MENRVPPSLMKQAGPGPTDLAKGYIIGNDLLMGFALVVVVARFHCRTRMGTKRGLRWDDLFILVSLVRGPGSVLETCFSWLTKLAEGLCIGIRRDSQRSNGTLLVGSTHLDYTCRSTIDLGQSVYGQ
jgi:hypothetical protein